MPRISNLTKYPYDYNVTDKDFVIGTDGDNKKTTNFPVVALAKYVRNFIDVLPNDVLPNDVLEYTNLTSFPKIGKSGKIYIAVDTNVIYRWSGTEYEEISISKQFVTDSIAEAIAGLQDNRLEFNEFSDFPAIGDETKFYIDLSEDKIYIWDSNSQTYKSQSWGYATVGSRSQQLSLSSVFRINQDGNANKIDVTAGVLFSQTLDETWNVSALVTTIPDNDYRYVYTKASKTTSTASIFLSKNQIIFDSDVNDYYFLVGVLHSVTDGVRVLSITVGTTTISGGLIRTGIISSLDGLTSFNLNTGEIKGKITFSSGSNGYENLTDKPDLSSFEQTRDYVNSTLQTDLTDLKNRADGVIESWFYSHTPTLSNLPASNWVTTEERNAHIGDTFTNMQESVDNVTTPDAGKAWRFVKNETTGEFSWSLIANSDSIKALIEAGKAKDTADAKRRVFVSQPYPPYNVGDLWVQGNGGDIMRCKFERLSGTYVATDFEKASKYTDDTAVNNLQIGGRNLILNSGITKENSSFQIATYSLASGTYVNGEDYTITIWGELASGKEYFSIYNTNGDRWLVDLYKNSKGGYQATFKWTNKINESSSVNNSAIQVYILPNNGSGVSKINRIKLEKGNKATDWTPAPEDVVAEYTALVNQEIAEVRGEIAGLETTVNGAFKDGIIEEAEARAIEKYINSLNAEKADLSAKYTTTYNDVNLTDKSALQTAWSNYDASHGQLITSINTAISDGRATAADRQDVDLKFADYKNKLAALSTSFENAFKAIEQKKIDNIQIGGRNFALGTKTPKSNSTGWIIYPLSPEMTSGDYVLTYDYTTAASNMIGISLGNAAGYDGAYEHIENIQAGVGKFSQKITFVRTNQTHLCIYVNAQTEIRNLKLEKGNKATDWTPAPEDIDSAILNAQNSANTANNLLSEIANDNLLTPLEKQSTKKEWDIIVGEKSVVESQANTLGVSTTSYVNAYNSLNSYITPLLANLTVNSAIVGSDFRTTFKNYYDSKIALLKAVTDKLKSNTDVVKTQLDIESAKVINLENKTDFLTGTTIEGNAIATGTLLVGNSDGTNAGITGLGSTSDGVYLWGGGTYQQMIQGLAKKEQRRNGIDIWRHPNGQIGFEIGIKDGRLIFNGYHSSGFKLFELDPNRGLVNVSYTQESWTETPFRKLNYSSSTYNESTIASEIQGFLTKSLQSDYMSPPPYNDGSEFVTTTTYTVLQNAVGYDYDNGSNPANASYESLKGMKANYGDRNTNMSNGWYMSDIGEIHMESEWNSYPPHTYTFTVYVYYYQNGKITQTKVVTVTK